jgi:hypothetical protein
MGTPSFTAASKRGLKNNNFDIIELLPKNMDRIRSQYQQ